MDATLYPNDEFLRICITSNSVEESDFSEIEYWVNHIGNDIPLNENDAILLNKLWIYDSNNKFWYNTECKIETDHNTIFKAWMPDHGLCVYKRIKYKFSDSINEHQFVNEFQPLTIPYIIDLGNDGLVYPYKGPDLDMYFRNKCNENISKEDFHQYSICASLIVHHKFILNTVSFIANALNTLYEKSILWPDIKLPNILFWEGKYNIIDVGSFTNFNKKETSEMFTHLTFEFDRSYKDFNTCAMGLIVLEMICTRFDFDILLKNTDKVIEILNRHKDYNEICSFLVNFLFRCHIFVNDTVERPMPWPELYKYLTESISHLL